jgi:hypothetical protein
MHAGSILPSIVAVLAVPAAEVLLDTPIMCKCTAKQPSYCSHLLLLCARGEHCIELIVFVATVGCICDGQTALQRVCDDRLGPRRGRAHTAHDTDVAAQYLRAKARVTEGGAPCQQGNRCKGRHSMLLASHGGGLQAGMQVGGYSCNSCNPCNCNLQHVAVAHVAYATRQAGTINCRALCTCHHQVPPSNDNTIPVASAHPPPPPGRLQPPHATLTPSGSHPPAAAHAACAAPGARA